MTLVDRWLLPDGIDEVLPSDARRLEALRRRLLDLFHRWGYDLVIPPLVEYTESLLVGLGSDLDLLTFKVTDQLTGRLMGIRADITPQIARLDAHALPRAGVSRLCYAGTVLHTKPKSLLASRSPIQLGAECYGEPSVAADGEVIALLLTTLAEAGVEDVHLDLGHVGIFRELAAWAGLDAAAERALFDALQRKAQAEIDSWLADNLPAGAARDALAALPGLVGAGALDRAEQALAGAPAPVADALAQLRALEAHVQREFPGCQLCVDLAELRGYHYHTGVVFAAYASGHGQAIANGGRYDHVGEAFGRARPATGFAADLKALAALGREEPDDAPGIFAPASDDPAQAQAISELRAAGERVVCGFPGSEPRPDEIHCDRRLVAEGGRYHVKPWQ